MKSLRRISNLHRISVIIIALLSSAATFVQSIRATSLIDYSYQMENAYRIFSGEIPYRDFYLVLPPGLYAMMAVLMAFTGGYNHIVQTIAVCLVPFLTVIFAYLIIKHYCGDLFAIFCCIPLIFTGQSIASYDTVAVLFILISYYLLIRTEENRSGSRPLYIALGSIAIVTALVKQNIGLVYWVCVSGVIIASGIRTRYKQAFMHGLWYISGGVITCGLFFWWLYSHHAWNQFIYQVFVFPGSVRNPLERGQFVLSQYVDVFSRHVFAVSIVFIIAAVWIFFRLILGKVQKKYTKWLTFILILLLAFLLEQYALAHEVMSVLVDTTILSWEFVVLVYFLTVGFVLFSGKKTFPAFDTLMPFAVIAGVHAIFLSSGVYASGYGVWPLFVVVAAVCVIHLELLLGQFPWRPCAVVCISFISVLLFVKTYRIELSYPVTDLSGVSQTASMSRLKGLSTPGGYISRFENLLSYAGLNIPQTDGVVFLPGEDPFFSATNRKNPLSFSQYHQATLPLSEIQVIDDIRLSGARWIIINRFIQIRWDAWPVLIQPVIDALGNDFPLYVSLPGYDIYKRN